MKKSPIAVLGGVAGTLSLVMLAATPAGASNSWNGYHWASSGQAQINVINSSTSDWTPRLQKAVGDWSKSSKLSLSVSQGDTSNSARRRCSAPSGNAIRVCNYTYGQTGWLGIASIQAPGGHITTGTDKQNETYLSTGQYNESARQHVVCQEIGHLWGLDHQFTNVGSCMDYAGLNDPAYVSPNQHDFDQLSASYNHSDGAAATASTGTSKIRTGSTVTSILWAD